MPNSTPSLTSDPGGRPNPDRTERQKAEELARKERDPSAAVLDTAGALTERNNVRLLNDIIDGCSPSAIFLKDRDGKFITINAPLEKMLGVSRDELRGKTDYDLFSKEVADLYRAHDTKVMATGKAIQVEEAADLPDGHHFFLANKFPLVAADGRIYGVGAISHDITERKRAEEALAQAGGGGAAHERAGISLPGGGHAADRLGHPARWLEHLFQSAMGGLHGDDDGGELRPWLEHALPPR